MKCCFLSLCVLALTLAVVSGQRMLLQAPPGAPPAGTYNTITTTTDCNGKQTVKYENIPANGPGITRNNNNNCNSGGGTITNNNGPTDNSFASTMGTSNNNNNNNGGGTITNNNGVAAAAVPTAASPALVRNANGLLVPASALRSLAPAPAPGAAAAGVIPPGTADAAQAAPGAAGSTITNNNGVAAPGTVNNNNNGPVPAGAAVNNNMNGPAGGTVNNNMNGPAGGTINNNNNGGSAAAPPGAPPAGTYNTITTTTDCVTGTTVKYEYIPANGPGVTRNNENTCNSPGSNTITNNNG